MPGGPCGPNCTCRDCRCSSSAVKCNSGSKGETCRCSQNGQPCRCRDCKCRGGANR
ncbi:hypothetical protein X975_17097, partial [Stegodyphus mimosarum]